MVVRFDVPLLVEGWDHVISINGRASFRVIWPVFRMGQYRVKLGNYRQIFEQGFLVVIGGIGT